MRKIVTFVLIFLLSGLKINSIERRSQPGKQKTIHKRPLSFSKDVIDKVKKTLSIRTFFMKFEYKFKDADIDKSFKKEDVDLLIKNDKFYLNSHDYKIKCNGQILWKYIVNVNQLQITYAKDFINFWSMLSCYDKYYNIEMYQDVVLNGVMCLEVILIAKSPDNDYNSIRIFFKKSSFDLLKIKINELNGIKHIIYICQFEKKQKIEDNIFNWNYNDSKNIEIIDLRK